MRVCVHALVNVGCFFFSANGREKNKQNNPMREVQLLNALYVFMPCPSVVRSTETANSCVEVISENLNVALPIYHKFYLNWV